MLDRNRKTKLKAADFNVLDDFQNLVNTYNLHNMNEVYKQFPYIGKKLKILGFKDKIKFVEKPIDKKPGKYSDYQTTEDFQKYIIENNIKSAADFLLKNPGLYNWMSKLRLTRTVVYPESIELKKEKENKIPKTLKDFQEFIDRNKITSSMDFSRRFNNIYKKLRDSGLSDKVYYYGKLGDNKRFIESFKFVRDFQNYINTNNIKSPKEFKIFNKRVYSRMVHLKLSDKVVYSNKKLIRLLPKDSYKTPDEIIDYINKNNIITKKEFRENHAEVYRKFLKLSLEDRNKIIFKGDPKDFSYITVDWVNSYIEENNIEREVDIRKSNPRLSDAIYRRLTKEQRAKLKYKKKASDYSEYNDFDSIQNFVKDNYIINKKDFHLRFPGIYLKYTKLRDGWDKDIEFINSPFTSIGEFRIAVALLMRGVSFISQKTFSDLKNIDRLRYDFYLPGYNIIIEHHGEGHFGKGRYYSKDLIESDKMKNKYAKDHGIKILYFTIYKNDYENLGYFEEVITDLDELFNIIDPNLKILENGDELVNNYFKDDIVYYNTILKNSKITSEKAFKKYSRGKYEKAKMLNILDKLTYYSEEQDLQE